MCCGAQSAPAAAPRPGLIRTLISLSRRHLCSHNCAFFAMYACRAAAFSSFINTYPAIARPSLTATLPVIHTKGL